MDGPSRVCPRHRLELVERDRARGLRCPRGHGVAAWLVLLDGAVIGAGRFDGRGRVWVWLARGFPGPVELLDLLIDASAEPHRLAEPRGPLPSVA